METEKSSYTLNHNGEEHDESKTESYEPLIEEDGAVETDKMLLKDVPAVKKSTEILAEPTESTALAEKVEAVKEIEGAEVPIKNRFLQLFDRKKPKTEPTETQNGTTTEVDGATEPNPNPKRRFIPLKLTNPFAKKGENGAAATVAPAAETTEKPNNEASSSDEKKDESSEEKKTETKFKPLATISFSTFSGLINKFRRSPRSDDIELGNGRRAGLASMETLDDSTKDPWNQENGGDAVDAEKTEELKQPEKGAQEGEEKKVSLIASIQNYNCSIDDIALIAGILLFFLLVALILAFTFLGTTKQTRIAPIRDGKVLAVTSCGLVEGLVEDSAIAFRGIPYAKPPINDLRFEFSQPIDDIRYCWNGTFEAHNSSTECLQNNNGEIEGVEDCLVLDIITPEVRYINLLPVVVMIGANDFMGGSPGILRPSARYARSKDVIFVRPRFRLNVLGFLSLETLSNSSNIPTSGNYALSDIITALDWIQNNIQNFGGDPSAVTLFGHRTGATLVTALTSSSKASKLFARAWVSSPSAHFSGKSLTESERESANLEFAKSFPECNEKSCWQKQDSKALLEKVPKSWSNDLSTSLPTIGEVKSNIHDFLVLDGSILKKTPEKAWESDSRLATKLVIGTTAHAAYDPLKPLPFSVNLTAEEVRKYVNESQIGEAGLTEEALALYGETVQGLISMISDIRYVCPLLVLARTQQGLPFYIVTQTQGDLKLADVDSDVQAILGRYSSETPEKRRYLDAIRHLFFYYVGHGKLNHYRSQNFILNIEQDVLPQSEHANCNFWIKNDFVPRYATVY